MKLCPSARSSFSSFLLQTVLQTTKSHYTSLKRAYIHTLSIIPSIQHASGDRCAVKTYWRACGNACPPVLASPTSISIDYRRYYPFGCFTASPLSTRSSSRYKVRSRSSVLEAEGELWSAHSPPSLRTQKVRLKHLQIHPEEYTIVREISVSTDLTIPYPPV